MKNLPKEKRDRLILIGIGTLAMIGGIWYGVIKSTQQSLVNIRRQIAEQKDKVGGAQRLVQSSPDIQKNLDAASARLKAMEAGMPSGDMYAWMILTMNKFRADHKVEIPQISREVAAEVGLFPKFPYKAAIFTVRGTAFFHDLGKFIADFENTFPYMRLQNLELEPASASSATAAGNPELLAFKMEIVTLINPNTL